MISDKDLLLSSAKVLSISGEYFDSTSAGGKGIRVSETSFPNWNPIDDDGDALRLAVTLGLNVSVEPYRVYVFAPVDYDIVVEYGDKFAATRMAIVLAASEIGKVK